MGNSGAIDWAGRPYHDELLYSYLATLSRVLAPTSTINVGLALFGEKDHLVEGGLPGRLTALVERLPDELGLTAERIICDHTLFNF